MFASEPVKRGKRDGRTTERKKEIRHPHIETAAELYRLSETHTHYPAKSFFVGKNSFD